MCDWEGSVVINAPHEIPEDLLVAFKEELRRLFNELLIVRPVDFAPTAHIQHVNEMYVTLSSITYEEALKLISRPQQLRGSQLLKAATQTDAESKHSQELDNLHTLLSSHQGAQARSAILFGSAGSGKSLTTLKILSEWNSRTSSSPFKQFDTIIYINGRERSRLRAKNVADLWQLQQIGFNVKQELFILNHFSHHSNKVLFLIDGWDEGGDGLLEENTTLNKS